MVKAYVFSSYLDRHVSLERGGFEFQMEDDLQNGISQSDIEHQAAAIAKEAVGADIRGRQEKKRERVQSYVDGEAPWHKYILEKIDLSGMPLNPSNEEIETRLQKEKFAQEIHIKREVSKILSGTTLEGLEKSVKDVVSTISGTSQNDLIHYIALRRNILDLFGRSLEVDEKGVYSSEGLVHDIIFPRKGDTLRTPFMNHNLYRVRNSSYRNLAELTDVMASRDLKAAVDAGFLVPDGERRGRVYIGSLQIRALFDKLRLEHIKSVPDPFVPQTARLPFGASTS